MAGKQCFGSDYNNAGAGHLRSSKAFCEGVTYRAKGAGAEYPVTDNPHADDGDSDANAAWVAGWSIADAAAPDAPDLSGTCCAAVGTVLE